MPSYFYRARDGNGRAHEGIEVAASEDEVLRILENSHLTPVHIESRTAGGSRIARKEWTRPFVEAAAQWQGGIQPASIALFARQLSTMIGAGLPLVRALRSINRDHYDKRLSKVLEAVADDVPKGQSLSAALGRHPHVFDELFVSLVNTGEVSGTLDQIMNHTASYLEKAEVLRLKVEAALRYPMFVLSFAALVMVAMIVKIVPMFATIYSRFRVALPLPTRILLGISDVITSSLLLTTALTLIVGTALWYWAQTSRGRDAIDKAKFNLPIFGSLIRMYAVTKFARTLGILTTSGTHMLYALKVMKPVPGNRVMERGIDYVRSRVEEGSSLNKAMSDSGVFPEMLVQMTATGEETGQLDTLLMRTADFYEQRVTAAVEGLSSLIEPIAIVVLGALVGLMLIALYLPIFSLGRAMQQGLVH